MPRKENKPANSRNKYKEIENNEQKQRIEQKPRVEKY